MADTLDSFLASTLDSLTHETAAPHAHPSGFGPLHLPEPGQLPESMVHVVAGLPGDFLESLVALRRAPDFFPRVYAFARRHARLSRVIRQVGWALVRAEPAETGRILEFIFSKGDLGAPGEISFLCDLAEERPRALLPFLPRILGLLLERDQTDPGDGGHRLSDLVCMSELSSEFLNASVAPVWEKLPDTRVRRILLRWLVFRRALPLLTYRGSIEERLHRPKTRYQSYSYHLLLGGEELRVLDLSQEIQLNLCELPKYAPSNHLRRFAGKRIEAQGYVDRLGEGSPTILLQALQELDPPPPPRHEERPAPPRREERPAPPRREERPAPPRRGSRPP